MFRRIAPFVVSIAALAGGASAQEDDEFFEHSYALVVGINSYGNAKWPRLNYAVNDAKGVARFLSDQGFEVIELYEAQATKAAIIATIEDELVPRLTERDRVVLFFAGHGETRALGDDTDIGYLVPIDGTDKYGSLIPVDEIHRMSSLMGAAKHQLFILDSCFGGLAATRAGQSTIDPRTPNYVYDITRRKARQLLTAGGANQRVRDGGPGGHSYFTGQLLEALEQGTADKNGDGFITFSELSAFIQVAASAYDQTPGIGYLDGHQQGEFLFVNQVNPASRTTEGSPADADTVVRSGATADAYESLVQGKVAFQRRDFVTALEKFRESAERGNAEAMLWIAKIVAEGLAGRAPDKVAALDWLRRAAERGDINAMKNLIAGLREAGPEQDLAEAARWEATLMQAELVAAELNIFDPSGEAGRGEPTIPAEATVVRFPQPAAPTGLRAQ